MEASSARSRWRDVAPAVIVLFLTCLYVLLSRDPSVLRSWRALMVVGVRFFRFTLLLCLPLYLLPALFGRIVERHKKALLHVEQPIPSVRPLKHWFFRPLQGIGIGFLFSTKLLGILQVISGPQVTSSLIIPQGHFELGRLLMTSAITVFISVLLSVLWTLDDLGIRYFNHRDHELKMIGKYVGTLMPVIFGFYGILSLLANYSTAQGLIYVAEIAGVLYPPMVVFAVAHTYFIGSRVARFRSHEQLTKGGVWHEP